MTRGDATDRDDAPVPPRRSALETASEIGGDPSPAESSATFSPAVIEDIQIKAELGRYRIRGFGALRRRTWATFDDLTFVPGTLTRIPLEGYREACDARTVLGTRFAAKPIELDIPLMVTGMSYGALSRTAKTALAAARMAGTSTTTGDGGMLDVERSQSRVMIYEVLPSRYGINIQHLRQADAIEITIGQGAKPGTGGLLLGAKVSGEIAQLRDLPPGVDQRSPCRHPDFLGPDDLIIKIEELREATDHQVPIFVKMGATRVFDDVRLAAKAGADVIVVDGMEGGTGASPELLQEHTGIPTLAAVCEARAALEDIGLYGKVQLVIAGGLRHGSDCAKAMALGRRRVLPWHRSPYCPRLQQADLHRGLPQDRRGAVFLPPLPHGPLPGRDHDAGSRALRAPGRRGRRRAGGEFFSRAHVRNTDPGPGVRQEQRAPSGAGGFACAQPGSVAGHRTTAGRNEPGLRRRTGLEGRRHGALKARPAPRIRLGSPLNCAVRRVAQLCFGPTMSSGRTQASNWSAVSSPRSMAASRRVMPFAWACFAILAALS